MNQELPYPDSGEVGAVLQQARNLQDRLEEWHERADAVDEAFINSNSDQDLHPDQVPYGEERAQVRNEIRPGLRQAVSILMRVVDGKGGENGLSPVDAQTKFEEAEALVEQAEDDVAGLPEVRDQSLE